MNYFTGRLFFDHLQKTGGTAVTKWFLDNLGAGCVLPHASGEYYEVINKFGGNYSVLSAHIYFRQDRYKLHPLYKHVTLLRDPIERAISYIRFITNVDASSCDPNFANYVTLFLTEEGEIPESIIQKNKALHNKLLEGISNIYTKHFSAYIAGDVSQNHFDSALAFINHYNYIGFTDDIQNFLGAITDIVGLKLLQPIKKVNVTPSNSIIDTLINNEKILSKLADLNKYDIALYKKLRSSSKKRKIFNSKLTPKAKPLYDVIVNELDTEGTIKIESYPKKVMCMEEFIVTVKIHNNSNNDWPGRGNMYPVLASYHWHDANDNKLFLDSKRTVLETIKMNTSKIVSVNVIAPDEIGIFTLEVTLVQELIMWFETRKLITDSVEIEVSSSTL